MTLKQKRKCRRSLLFSAFSLILICLFLFVEKDMKHVVHEVAISDAQSVNERIINNAVYSTLKENKVDFNKVISINYDKNNVVKSVSTDSIYFTNLKFEIIKKINEEFRKEKVNTVSINLGSFIDNEFTYGRGPRINFNYEFSNTIVCEYHSEFESTGINQARHRFELIFTTDVYLVTPLFSTKTTFNTEILLNEMLIAGNVPDNYTDLKIK